MVIYSYDPRQDIIDTIGTSDTKGYYLTVSGVKVYLWVDEESHKKAFPIFIFSLRESTQDMVDIGGDKYTYTAYIDVNIYVPFSKKATSDVEAFIKTAVQVFAQNLKANAKLIPNTVFAQVARVRDASILELEQVKRYLIEVECIGIYE
jgi:hypothetical protein